VFSIREEKSPAESFSKFRHMLRFPPKPHS
jgi:hypothetical protein